MSEAVRLDPACAMCLWGQALVAGPTINYGSEPKERAPLLDMVRKAKARRLGLPEPKGVWDLPYHAHNVIFGLGGAMMAGDGRTALNLARPLVERSTDREKAEPFSQMLAAAGYFGMARFDDPTGARSAAEASLRLRPRDPIAEDLLRRAEGMIPAVH